MLEGIFRGMPTSTAPQAPAEASAAAAAAAGGPPPPRTTHGQLQELRRELNALVSIAHHRTGKTHGQIHNELRQLCGGPVLAAATGEQIKARIDAVRGLRSGQH